MNWFDLTQAPADAKNARIKMQATRRAAEPGVTNLEIDRSSVQKRKFGFRFGQWFSAGMKVSCCGRGNGGIAVERSYLTAGAGTMASR